MIWKNLSAIALNTSILIVVYIIEIIIFIYKRYAYNLDQSNFSLFVDYTIAKIVIILEIDCDFIKH